MTDVPNADSLTGLTRNRQILPLIVSPFFLSDLLVCLPFIYLPLAFSSIFYQFVTTRRNFVIDILRAIYWAAMWFVGKCVFPIYDSASGARRRIFFNETEKLENEMQRDRESEREGEIVCDHSMSLILFAPTVYLSQKVFCADCVCCWARLHPSFVLSFLYIAMELGWAGDREPRMISEISICFYARKHDRRNRHRAIGGQRTKMYNNCVCPFYGWQRFVFSFYIYITCNKNDRSCKHVSRESEDF